jgi:hypothetical protein
VVESLLGELIILALVGNVPLPIAREVHTLTTLHCQRRYAAHLIAIRDAAVNRPGSRRPLVAFAP